MSFRDRNDPRSEWEADNEEAAGWSRRPVPRRGAGARGGAADEDLPAWPADMPAGSDQVEEDAARRRRRSDRRSADFTDEHPSDRPPRVSREWPSLRDSLRGGADTLEEGSRSRRTVRPAPSGAARRTPATWEDDWTAWRTAADRDDDTLEPHADDVDDFVEPYARRRDAVARGRLASRRPRHTRSRPSVQMPTALVALAAGTDRAILISIGVTTFSLLFMVAMIVSRIDALPPWIAIHLDAAGRPDRWGTASTVWRLPLMAGMLTVMNLVAAWFMANRDALAARFLVASSILIHLLVWIGLIHLLW